MITLRAKQINHGQSEVWLDAGDIHIVATNAVRNCVQATSEADAFKAFWDAYPNVGGDAVTFQVPEDAARKYRLIR